MPDEDDDGSKTVATSLPTIPPVDTLEDLPALSEEGAICFVRDRGESYVYVDGAWKPRKHAQLS
jgi:hypothetical protein